MLAWMYNTAKNPHNQSEFVEDQLFFHEVALGFTAEGEIFVFAGFLEMNVL